MPEDLDVKIDRYREAARRYEVMVALALARSLFKSSGFISNFYQNSNVPFNSYILYLQPSYLSSGPPVVLLRTETHGITLII